MTKSESVSRGDLKLKGQEISVLRAAPNGYGKAALAKLLKGVITDDEIKNALGAERPKLSGGMKRLHLRSCF